MKYYTVYDKKTETVVAFGNSKRCTEMMGLPSANSFYSIVHNARIGKNQKWEVVVEELEGDDE